MRTKFGACFTMRTISRLAHAHRVWSQFHNAHNQSKHAYQVWCLFHNAHNHQNMPIKFGSCFTMRAISQNMPTKFGACFTMCTFSAIAVSARSDACFLVCLFIEGSYPANHTRSSQGFSHRHGGLVVKASAS